MLAAASQTWTVPDSLQLWIRDSQQSVRIASVLRVAGNDGEDNKCAKIDDY